jgi:polyisoprenoid-binding protein YceI
MKKLLVASAIVLMGMSAVTSKAQNNWAFDAAHSKLGFTITHLSISDVDGSFKISQASIVAPKNDFTDAKISLIADVKSVYTDNSKRDEHLRGTDFFDAEKFPNITFTSTSCKKVGDNNYKVTGDLTMHGKTNKVTLDATAKTAVHPMNKKEMAGFKVTGTIKRTDYGISVSSPDAMLSNEVKIVANVEFEKK